MKWENCWSDGCPPKISRGHIFWLYLKKHCLALQPSSPLFHLFFWELFKVHLWWKDNIFLWNFLVFVEWKMSFWEKYYVCFADWGGFFPFHSVSFFLYQTAYGNNKCQWIWWNPLALCGAVCASYKALKEQSDTENDHLTCSLHHFSDPGFGFMTHNLFQLTIVDTHQLTTSRDWLDIHLIDADVTSNFTLSA